VRRTALTWLRYLAALGAQFRSTIALAIAVFGLVPIVFAWRYEGAGHERISYWQAFHHVYFLLLDGPSLGYLSDPVLELLDLALPPLGLLVLADGAVRLGGLLSARRRNAKEWVAVVASAFDGHVVVCGAGRVGYRVAKQLRALGRDLVMIERNQEGGFVSALVDAGVPVLIDDIRSKAALERANLARAASIVAVTDDDLANLNVCLDARRVNPKIRVVIRLFDEDLIETVRGLLGAEAISTSAFAAPHIALTATDPAVLHSFQVGGHLMVVCRLDVTPRLSMETVKDLRDVHGALTLAVHRGSAEEMNPSGDTRFEVGTWLTVQAEWSEWNALRRWAAGEA
jgi:Trk K+ transport system NAD-binding subunit